MRTLAVSNYKGGVGKTTTAVNLAAIYAARGLRVLLIDLDPQGNSSSGLGINKKSIRASSYEVLIGSASAETAIMQTQFDCVSVMPSNINLAGAEFDLFEMEKREYRLMWYSSEGLRAMPLS